MLDHLAVKTAAEISETELVSLDAGEFLFREGDAADALYIVRKGTLRVVSGSTVYETLKPGGIVGEDGYCRSISPSQCLGDRRHACRADEDRHRAISGVGRAQPPIS